jgi:hypothetical protein
MKQETAAPDSGERVAFTLRLDGPLDFDLEVERAALARHLGVRAISKNDFLARVVRFYLAAPEAERMNWKPAELAPVPAATNGHNGKKGR